MHPFLMKKSLAFNARRTAKEKVHITSVVVTIKAAPRVLIATD